MEKKKREAVCCTCVRAASLAVPGAASGRERAAQPILAYLSAVANNDSLPEKKSVRAKTNVAAPRQA